MNTLGSRQKRKKIKLLEESSKMSSKAKKIIDLASKQPYHLFLKT
ncbi:hypothetical protein SAMN06297358_2928 [Pedobacter xixiisoli]|uniref:Uncharacterized protein n=1 Tax=Pedobacter xixiisoli TaxID=1476464 RepID=A0A286A8Q0_9SPHI|nr:hypothetical protein SAMN06297358_2928 [Pedobacter xixiisoli]